MLQGFVEQHQEDKDYASTVSAIIDRLKGARIPFLSAIDLLKCIVRSLSFETDAHKLNSMRIFEKLMIQLESEDDPHFMEHVCELLLQNQHDGNECLFKWCVEKWHLADANENRDLVRELLDNPEYGFDYYTIFGLHSDIRHFPDNDDHLTKVYFEKTMNCLAEVDGTHCDVVSEIESILLSKMDMELFGQVYHEALGENDGQ